MALEAERNYDIYDLELLAIIKACRHWQPYLAGSPHKVIIHTDHANLQYWHQPHKISQRIAREVLDVTDLQGPPSERTPEQKLWDFKTRAQQYARDRESCDDVRISYLEFLETEAEDDLALARMIAG
jgi:hypothetical protein